MQRLKNCCGRWLRSIYPFTDISHAACPGDALRINMLPEMQQARDRVLEAPASSEIENGQKTSYEKRFKWLELILFVYFGLRLIYFAVTISPHVPPDEATHFGVSTIFSSAFLLPDNSTESYQFGLVTNIPWLYYWIMGKLLQLNLFGVPDLVFLRILNIPFAFATVYFVRRLTTLFTDDIIVRLLVVVAMTNTLMFSFLSASVSYDNLTNLLAAMSFYYLTAFFKERSAGCLVMSIISVLAGCLTKVTFLPLVPLFFLLLVVREAGNVGTFVLNTGSFFKEQGRAAMVMLAAILVGLLLNIQLYGGNYLKYKTISPSVKAVLPLEQAMQYRITARDIIIDQFILGQISLDQAHEMASQITHPGDRQDTLTLVDNYAYKQQTGFKPIGPLPYTAIWFLQMLSTSFGIKAHIGMPNHGFSFIPLAVLILFVIAAFVVRWRPRDMAWLPTSLLAVSVCYAAIILVGINYPNYLDKTDIVMSVAGRYIFPVMAPVYVVSCVYLMRLFKSEKMRLGLAVFAALVLIFSDFPFFLANVTSAWYALATP